MNRPPHVSFVAGSFIFMAPPTNQQVKEEVTMGVGREAGKVMSKKLVAQVTHTKSMCRYRQSSLLYPQHTTPIPPPPNLFFKKNYQDSSGSTAVIALVTPTLLAVANLGDSRAVLLSSSSPNDDDNVTLTATPLSFDHKPELPAERARVERAGAWVGLGLFGGGVGLGFVVLRRYGPPKMTHN